MLDTAQLKTRSLSGFFDVQVISEKKFPREKSVENEGRV
jgi:hypothetical protein